MNQTRADRPLICVLGQHELDYPRNIINQRAIRDAGYDILVVHSRAPGVLRALSLFKGYLGCAGQTQAVFVTEGSHRFVPMIKLIAAIWGSPVIFDPFTSKYNTYVEDRRKYRKFSLGALRCWWMDWSSMKFTDYCIFDTEEHREYFYKNYAVNHPYKVLEVGVDDDVFGSPPSRRTAKSDVFDVLFWGTFIPLHGIEHIVEAATRLRETTDIRITLIGGGQTHPQIVALINARGLKNIKLESWLAPEALVQRMMSADVCLGIFGDTVKAANVVPNKLVQAAALSLPVITRASTSVERYFVNNESAVLVQPANGGALADAIVRLKTERRACDKVALGARKVFEQHFSQAALTQKMGEFLRMAVPHQHARSKAYG